MAAFGWLCGGLTLLLVLGYLYFTYVLTPIQAKKEAEKRARIERDGRPVYCWIVVANPDLFQEKDTDEHSYAQVVYTLAKIPNPEERLKPIAERLNTFEANEGAPKEERIIGSVMKTHMPYFDPLRLPERVAGDLEAYTVSVRVPWRKLPERRLTRPYIWCKILDGEDDNVRMISYPDSPTTA
jgi:hypothetical protein